MEENLKELIQLFYDNKQSLDKYKKLTEEYNKEIKEELTELGLNEFESDDLLAKITIQKRESFNEPRLIEKLLELGHKEIINLVPVIDYDKLEDFIYNGKIDASDLSEFKEVKEVTTLKVSKKKGGK